MLIFSGTLPKRYQTLAQASGSADPGAPILRLNGQNSPSDHYRQEGFDMKYAKTLACLAIVALLATPAERAVAGGHWLIGGSIGNAAIDDAVDGFRFDSDSTSYRLFAGYQFNSYLALEAGYLDLGSFNERVVQNGTVIPVSADADGFTFNVRGSVPAGEHFALHASVGSFFWDGASRIAGIDNNVSDSNLYFSVAASFDVTNNMALKIEASQYELDGVDANVVAAGFQINFR